MRVRSPAARCGCGHLQVGAERDVRGTRGWALPPGVFVDLLAGADVGCVLGEAERAEPQPVLAELVHNGHHRVRCEKNVYSYDGPIRHRKRGYILTTDQSDAGSHAHDGHHRVQCEKNV
eukprot:1183524-Prorocentrum_minimum.AAC.1